MADPDLDFDGEAAEFVLGTLTAEERSGFLRRMTRDPAAAAAAIAWQERLAPLALALPEVTPPAGLRSRIEIAMDGAHPAAANDNRVARWRYATLAATMVAAVATGLAFQQASRPPYPAPEPVVLSAAVQPVSIAALTPSGITPVLFLSYNRKTGRVDIVPMKVDADKAHSLELWLIQGKDAPRSIGLIDAERRVKLRAPMGAASDATFAVSQEPQGGSRTGLPTGPVLWAGSLVHI